MKLVVLMLLTALASAEVFEFGETKTEVGSVPLVSSEEPKAKKLIPLSDAFQINDHAPRYSEYRRAETLSDVMPRLGRHLEMGGFNTSRAHHSHMRARHGPRHGKGTYKPCDGDDPDGSHTCKKIRGVYSVVAQSWLPVDRFMDTAEPSGDWPQSTPTATGSFDPAWNNYYFPIATSTAQSGPSVDLPIADMFIVQISDDCEVCVCSTSYGSCSDAHILGCTFDSTVDQQPIQISFGADFLGMTPDYMEHTEWPFQGGVDTNWPESLEDYGFSHFTFGAFHPSTGKPSFGLWSLGVASEEPWGLSRDEFPYTGKAVAVKLDNSDDLIDGCNPILDPAFKWSPYPTPTPNF